MGWGNGSFLWENAKTLHFLQMFGQDNVCFAVATITFFLKSARLQAQFPGRRDDFACVHVRFACISFYTCTVIYQFARTLICSILHIHICGIIYLFANIPIQLWIVMYFFNAFNILTYSYPCRFIFKFS